MPFASDRQRRYFNANRAELESQGVDVDEWNSSSRGKKLPEKVKDGKPVKGAKRPPRKVKAADYEPLGRQTMQFFTSLNENQRADLMAALSGFKNAKGQALADQAYAAEFADREGGMVDPTQQDVVWLPKAASLLAPVLLRQDAVSVLGRIVEKHHRRSPAQLEKSAKTAVRRLTAILGRQDGPICSVLADEPSSKTAVERDTAVLGSDEEKRAEEREVAQGREIVAASQVMLRAMRKDAMLRGPLRRAWHCQKQQLEKAGFVLPGSQGSHSFQGTPQDALAHLTASMQPHDPLNRVSGAVQPVSDPGDAVVGGGQGAGATSPAQNPIGQYGLNDNGSIGTNFGQPMNPGGLKLAGAEAAALWQADEEKKRKAQPEPKRGFPWGGALAGTALAGLIAARLMSKRKLPGPEYEPPFPGESGYGVRTRPEPATSQRFQQETGWLPGTQGYREAFENWWKKQSSDQGPLAAALAEIQEKEARWRVRPRGRVNWGRSGQAFGQVLRTPGVMPAVGAGVGFTTSPILADAAGIDSDMGRMGHRLASAATMATLFSPKAQRHIWTKDTLGRDLKKFMRRHPDMDVNLRTLKRLSPRMGTGVAPVRGVLTTAGLAAAPTVLGGYTDTAKLLSETLEAKLKENPQIVDPQYHIQKAMTEGTAKAMDNPKVQGWLDNLSTEAVDAIKRVGAGVGGGLAGSGVGYFGGKLLANAIMPSENADYDNLDEGEYQARRNRERIKSLIKLVGMYGGGVGGALLAHRLATAKVASALPTGQQAQPAPSPQLQQQPPQPPQQQAPTQQNTGRSRAQINRQLAQQPKPAPRWTQQQPVGWSVGGSQQGAARARTSA